MKFAIVIHDAPLKHDIPPNYKLGHVSVKRNDDDVFDENAWRRYFDTRKSEDPTMWNNDVNRWVFKYDDPATIGKSRGTWSSVYVDAVSIVVHSAAAGATHRMASIYIWPRKDVPMYEFSVVSTIPTDAVMFTRTFKIVDDGKGTAAKWDFWRGLILERSCIPVGMLMRLSPEDDKDRPVRNAYIGDIKNEFEARKINRVSIVLSKPDSANSKVIEATLFFHVVPRFTVLTWNPPSTKSPFEDPRK